jgi:hypothetical protein
MDSRVCACSCDLSHGVLLVRLSYNNCRCKSIVTRALHALDYVSIFLQTRSINLKEVFVIVKTSSTTPIGATWYIAGKI